jgi:multidrug efflux pump subunit AcrB
MALFGIYTLLAVPLRSYSQPLLIMSVIPFGIVGAIFGHVLMGWFKPGFSLTFMSVTGIVALTGVVVNGSLVLIYTLNRLRIEGAGLREAVLAASMTRFRPIVLTSITTFMGLLPLLLERSMQAQFLVPMATSLAFGVIFATLITLFMLPAGMLVLDDLARLPARLRERRGARVPDRPTAPGLVPGGVMGGD